MTTASIGHFSGTPSSLDSACAALAECARDVSRYHRTLSGQEAVQLIVDIECASRIVDHLQILAARLADEHHLAVNSTSPVSTSLPARSEQAVRADTSSASQSVMASADTRSPGVEMAASDAATAGFRDCAEFLRATLGISRAEAKRRLSLAEVVLPSISPTGTAVPPRLEALGAAVVASSISGRAATVVAQAMQRVRSFATPQQLESMEHHLTRQAMESDEDILRVLARRWEGVLDQDGPEPSDKVLRARQGVFLKGRHHGLHFLEIGATDEQFEHLVTVMNSTANPRVHSGSSGGAESGETRNAEDSAGAGSASGALTDERSVTRPQALLDGLVAACRIALTTTALPSTGGHRPQVMVTIDYKDLIGETQRAGHAVFSQQVSARNIRKLACDADIIPLVLGSKGQVLDVGRAQRLFPPHLRRALVARDKGCAFPDCSIPASWCEAHHMDPWSRGGSTSIDNGVLLCSRHHHVIHQGTWAVEQRRGIPWFTSPGGTGRDHGPRQNRYWQAGQLVHEELIHDHSRRTSSGPTHASSGPTQTRSGPTHASPGSTLTSSGPTQTRSGPTLTSSGSTHASSGFTLTSSGRHDPGPHNADRAGTAQTGILRTGTR